MQELAVLALGQITQPNEMGQYPIGALAVAQDVFIRSPGVVECSRITSTLQTTLGGVSEILIPSDAEMLAIANVAGVWKWQWFSGSTNNSGNMPVAHAGNGMTNYARLHDRFVVTSLNGPVTFDYNIPTSTAQRTPRLTGLTAPSIYAAAVVGGLCNALAASKHCTVVVIVSRKFADGYELISAVSNPADASAIALAADVYVSVILPASGGYQAGDVVEIYRTRSQDDQTAAGGPVSCDATYFLTYTYTLTSTDIANRGVAITDTTPDTGLGTQLYTNPGIGGGFATYIAPPVAPITCSFKGYTFLFNLTEPAQIELSVLAGIGVASTADPASFRATLVGGREANVTTTSGSNVLTSISAADMVGLKVGQQVKSPPNFPPGTYNVSALGGSSATLLNSAGGVTNAIATGGPVGVRFWDTIRLNGNPCAYGQGSSSADHAAVENIAYLAAVDALGLVFQADSLGYTTNFINSSPVPSTFSIAKERAAPISGGATFTIAATNGANYQPALPEFGATPQTVSPITIPNGGAWSESQLPDAWPPANRGHVGKGTVLAAYPTRDAIWLFCTDGLWRLSGEGGSVGSEGYDWRTDPVDSTLIISGPQAGCVMRDTVYAYTTRGFVSIDDNGGVNDQISGGLIGDLLPGQPYTQTNTIKVRADDTQNEVWIIINNVARVWNYITKTWVRNVQLTGATTNTYAYWPLLASLVLNDDAVPSAKYFDPSVNAYAAGYVGYQPIFGNDPGLNKQFIDVTFIFDPTIGPNGNHMPTVAVGFNPFAAGVTFPVGPSAPCVLTATDLRCRFLVNRAAPAMSQSCAVCLTINPATGPVPPRLWGMRMRYTPIGDQTPRRGG